jgi:type VII secretion-associated serine protease mycosin
VAAAALAALAAPLAGGCPAAAIAPASPPVDWTAGAGSPSSTASAAVAPCTPGADSAAIPWPVAELDLAAVHRVADGDGVVVAVIDSGVDPRNPQLNGAVGPGGSALPAPDGKPAAPADPHVDLAKHGTLVAGIIAARPRDGVGMVGVAPAAQILPFRNDTTDRAASGADRGQAATAATIAAGITWSVGRGADVINVSESVPADDPGLRAAVADARQHDVVVVAAAQMATDDQPTTDGQPTPIGYPAAYPGVIAVAGVDQDGTPVSDSAAGASVAVAAPAADVLTTAPGDGQCTGAGVGYAAAFVSGTAALLRGHDPDLSADQIAYRIEATADRPQLDQRNDATGWGLVDPLAALTMSLPAHAAFGPTQPGEPPATSAAPVRLAAAVSNPRSSRQSRERDIAELVGAIGLAACLGCAVASGLRRARRPTHG